METDVRSAHHDDLETIVGALTESFFDDPVMMWLFDAGVRRKRLDALWRLLTVDGYLPAGASTVLPGGDGAALWMPPGQSLDEVFWAEHQDEFVAGLGGEVERIGQLSDAMDQHHPEDPHWYLLAIGIRPVAQGLGLGGALLAHSLALADAAGQPAYLEATSPRSRVLYERSGFEVVSEFGPDDGPRLWGMWREPKSATDVVGTATPSTAVQTGPKR